MGGHNICSPSSVGQTGCDCHYNKLQSLTTVEKTLRVELLGDKARALCEVDDHTSMSDLLGTAPWEDDKPSFLIAHTTKASALVLWKTVSTGTTCRHRPINSNRPWRRYAIRNAFINELVALARQHPQIAGDLGYSVIEPFADEFHDRFINAGVAE